MFDTLLLGNFLDAELRRHILDEIAALGGSQAEVYGSGTSGRADPRVRSARKLDVTQELRKKLVRRLEESRETIARHFQVAIASCEEPQFLRYVTGDFFVAHQDGNTGLIHDDSMHRRISTVIFLSEPETYAGGDLALHGKYPDFDQRQIIPAAAGTLVAFRSETTHEVTPITHGERYTIVSWYRA